MKALPGFQTGEVLGDLTAFRALMVACTLREENSVES